MVHLTLHFIIQLFISAEYKTAVQKSAEELQKAHQSAFQERMSQFQQRLYVPLLHLTYRAVLNLFYFRARGSISKSPVPFDVNDEQEPISEADLDAFYTETNSPSVEPRENVSGTSEEPKPSLEALFRNAKVNTDLEVPSEAAKDEIESEDVALP